MGMNSPAERLARPLTHPDSSPGLDDGKRAESGGTWRGAMARSSTLRPLANLFAGHGTCLMYHRIAPDEAPRDTAQPAFQPNRSLIVSAGAFNEQMAYLSRHCNCLSLPQAIDYLKSGRLPHRSVVVTFDDGYLDNLTIALPILKAHGIPATVYVTTGLISQDASLWWYELEQCIATNVELNFMWRNQNYRFVMAGHLEKQESYIFLNRMLKNMDLNEQNEFMNQLHCKARVKFKYSDLVLHRQHLSRLAAEPLITIGAHTHNHPVLSRLSNILLRREVGHSRELLQSWTKRPVTHLAYPFGDKQQADKREFEVARELGFESAVTTRLGHIHSFHRNHLFALPRVAIDDQDCMARFEWKLSGLYCLVKRPLSRIRI